MTKTAEKTSIPAKPLISGSKVAGFEDNQIPVMDTETIETYTEQQIDEHCEKLDNVSLTASPVFIELVENSIQIIRQLQEQIKHPDFGTTGN